MAASLAVARALHGQTGFGTPKGDIRAAIARLRADGPEPLDGNATNLASAIKAR